jgi:hypothetical protein
MKIHTDIPGAEYWYSRRERKWFAKRTNDNNQSRWVTAKNREGIERAALKLVGVICRPMDEPDYTIDPDLRNRVEVNAILNTAIFHEDRGDIESAEFNLNVAIKHERIANGA